MTGDFSKLNFCIVGMGLIGGSYARALRNIGAGKILGVDIRQEALDAALAEGCIDEGDTEGGRFLPRADVFIFCLYAPVMKAWITERASRFLPGTLLTDTAGIKGHMPEEIQQLLPAGVEFLAGHPMAGREGQGFEKSDGTIFRGAGYIIVPHSRNTAGNISWLACLARALGCRRAAVTDAASHDRLMAYTSDLPHILAAVLMNSGTFRAGLSSFTAGSFHDMTRIADMNSALWTELLMENRDILSGEICAFQNRLETLKQMLERCDKKQMKTFFEEASERKRALNHEENSGQFKKIFL